VTKKPEKNQLVSYLEFITKKPKGFLYKDLSKKRAAPGVESTVSPRALQEKQGVAKKSRVQDGVMTPCKKAALENLNSKYIDCHKCPLAQAGRKQVVFGDGNPETLIMFVGEGPGRDEDAQGKPFVGRAGQLLNKIIEAMGFTREQVYISNVVKCRPPNNRVPLPIESDTCKNILLFKEIEIIKPKIICTLGATATMGLLGDQAKITKSRGIFHEFKDTLVLPTYHPAYLLRNPAEKKTVWEDMKKIMAKLDELKDRAG
jgi:uracil-DNA glycosylase family 4